MPTKGYQGLLNPPPLPTGKGTEQGSLFHYVKIEKRRDEMRVWNTTTAPPGAPAPLPPPP